MPRKIGKPLLSLSLPLDVYLENVYQGKGELHLERQWARNTILDTSLFCPGCRRLWARFEADQIPAGRCLPRYCYACGNGSLLFPFFTDQSRLPTEALRREFLIAHEAGTRYWTADFTSSRIHDSTQPELHHVL